MSFEGVQTVQTVSKNRSEVFGPSKLFRKTVRRCSDRLNCFETPFDRFFGAGRYPSPLFGASPADESPARKTGRRAGHDGARENASQNNLNKSILISTFVP
jgi:hypothetical protein